MFPTFLRVIAAVLLVAVLAGLGAYVYDVGFDAGFAEAARQAASSGDAAEVIQLPYRYGWHGGWGFGPFAIVFWILAIILVVGLVRAATGGGRPGGWGRGGYGRDRVEEWHRELHERDEAHRSAPPA